MNQAGQSGAKIALVCVSFLAISTFTHAAGPSHNTCVHEEGATPAHQLRPQQSKAQPQQSKESTSTKKFLMAILTAISKHRDAAKHLMSTPPNPEAATLKKQE